MKTQKADKNKNWLIGKFDKTSQYMELWKNHMLGFSPILTDQGA